MDLWSTRTQQVYRLILLKFGPRNPPGNVHMEEPVGQRRATTTACFCDAAGPLARFRVTLMPVRGASLTETGPVSAAAPIEPSFHVLVRVPTAPSFSNEDRTGSTAPYNRRSYTSLYLLNVIPLSLPRPSKSTHLERGKHEHELKAPSPSPLSPKNVKTNGKNRGSAFAFPIPQPPHVPLLPQPISSVRHWPCHAQPRWEKFADSGIRSTKIWDKNSHELASDICLLWGGNTNGSSASP